MNKCYYRIEWKNYPSDETPLNEQNLNKIDVAVDEMDNRIITLDSTKFDKSEAQLLVKYIEYDEDTGIFKITHYNGASYTIDTLLEKLAVNFDYDYQTQQLIIELSDGEIKYVDLSALITQYEFLDSETVAFSVDNGGKVTAIVKEGSIEEKHLRPDYLADIKVESAKAEASVTKAGEKANNSAQSALLSKSYSDGDSGIRDGEATDNAKYYSEQAKKYYENLEQAGTVTGVKGNSESSYRTGNVNLTAQNVGALPTTGGTMSGNLIMSGTHIIGPESSPKLQDIDLNGSTLELGLRNGKGVGNSWHNRLRFGDSGTVDIKSNEFDVTVDDPAGEVQQRLLRMTDARFLVDYGTKAGIKISPDDAGQYIKFGNNASIYCNDELLIFGEDRLGLKANGRLEGSFSGEMDMRVNAKASIRSSNLIQLIPNSASRDNTPDDNTSVDICVRTGSIRGIKDKKNKKPFLKNFGNIEADTFNAGMYVGIGSDKLYEPICGIMQFTDPRITSGRPNQYPVLAVEDTEYFETIYSGGHIFTDGFFYILNSHIDINNPEKDVTIKDSANNGVCMIGREFSPYYRDNLDFNLGSSNSKWGNVYAKTGTIITSDRNEKYNIKELSPEKAKCLVMGIKPSSFMYKDNNSGRTHFGMISQDIEELLEAMGWSSKDFAGFIKSPQIELEEIVDEDGKTKQIEKVIDGEYNYSLRYDEFIAPIIKVVQMQQQEIESLKVEKAQLEERLAKIEERLGIV